MFALPIHIPAVSARRVPRRIDYLTKSNAPSSMAGQQIPLAIEDCTVVQISTSVIGTMQFVPSVVHVVESALVATACCESLLHPFGISDGQLIVEALTAPLAQHHGNYERLEFFGDTLLKLYACLQVFAEPRNAHLPEGYLTAEATNLVNNARLQRAGVEIGLDRFMIHERFTPKKWKPEMNTPQEDDIPPRRSTSTKIVADHVEAVIAVAYLDNEDTRGRDVKAIALINSLLPEIDWRLPTNNVAALPSAPSTDLPQVEALSVVESILGYTFKRRHLLAEALNHSSVSDCVPTYGRLEFLGDAILQRLVNESVYKSPARYSQRQMHLRQATCVSHSYLAFLCLEACHEVERFDVSSDLIRKEAVLQKTLETKYLWQFMAHSNMDIPPAQQRSLTRYLECRDQIHDELDHNKTWPWALLASIAAPKFFSDIIESVLAAVFIDSGADLDISGKVLEKLGLMQMLQRLIEEPDMILEQPKTLLFQCRAKAGLPALKAKFRSHREASGQRYSCQLLLEGEVYAEVSDAWCDEEAVLRACEIGLERFGQELEASKMPEVEAEASQLSMEDKKRKREDLSPSTLSSMVGDD